MLHRTTIISFFFFCGPCFYLISMDTSSFYKTWQLKQADSVLALASHNNLLFMGGTNMPLTIYDVRYGEKIGEIHANFKLCTITSITPNHESASILGTSCYVLTTEENTTKFNLIKFPVSEDKDLTENEKLIATLQKATSKKTSWGKIQKTCCSKIMYPRGFDVCSVQDTDFDPPLPISLTCKGPEQKYLVYTKRLADQSELCIYDTTSKTLRVHKNQARIVAVAINNKETMLGVALDDKTFHLQDVNNKTIFSQQLSARINALTFSPNGTIIAIGCKDNIIHLVRTDKKQIMQLYGHKQAITSLTFSDDEHLISGSHDHQVIVWKNRPSLEKLLYAALHEKRFIDVDIKTAKTDTE